jgi:hypothetical protein
VSPAWLAAIAAAVVAVPVAAKITQQVWTASAPWKRRRRRQVHVGQADVVCQARVAGIAHQHGICHGTKSDGPRRSSAPPARPELESS